MMKKYSVLLLTLLLGLSSFQVFAEIKIGVIQIARVMEEAPQAQDAQKQLMDEFQPREQELKNMQKELQNLEQRLVRDQMTMKASERTKLERELLNKKRDFERDELNFRDDLKFRRAEILQKLERDMGATIEGFAEAKKFDILLFEGVVYASKSIDVTDELLSWLKKSKK